MDIYQEAAALTQEWLDSDQKPITDRLKQYTPLQASAIVLACVHKLQGHDMEGLDTVFIAQIRSIANENISVT